MIYSRNGKHINRDKRVKPCAYINERTELFKMSYTRINNISLAQIVNIILFTAELNRLSRKNCAYVSVIITLKAENNEANGLINL